jgi:hypothetical protein
VEGTDPFASVEICEELVHQVRGEYAVRSLVLAAETGSEGVAERFGGRIVGKFVLLPESQGEAIALEGLGEAEDSLVLDHITSRRDVPILIAEVSLEPAVEIVATAGHKEPTFSGTHVFKGTVLGTGHKVRGAKGFYKLDAAPGSKV